MESRWVTYEIKNGILFADYKKDATLDLESAIAMVEERIRFQKGAHFPIVNILNGMKMSSKKTRTFLAHEGTEGIDAGAFIVGDNVEQVTIDFFLTIEKPPIPVRTFTTREDAITWIHELSLKKYDGKI
jgi:hypothetical protein